MRKLLWIMGVLSFCVVAQATVSVTNQVVKQRAGTKLVDISYDVSCDTTNKVWVSLSVRNGSETVNAVSLSGDVDGWITIGTNKSIVWNMASDWNGNISSNMVFALIASPAPANMVLIPAGNNSGTDPDFGAYSLTVSNAFYMDKTEVTKAQWDEVYNWAVTNGYSFDNTGSGKAFNHPVQKVNWYDCVKWCNARSEKEGLTPCYTVDGSVYRAGQHAANCDFNAHGYRLPTIDEWQYAARGGLRGKRFPWGDTINHNYANYRANGKAYSYDTSPYTSYIYHPDYDSGETPYTSPVGSFAPNGYGLYDMAGNVWEWCNTSFGSYRAIQGGCWSYYASLVRCGHDAWNYPLDNYYSFGFRAVRR